MNDAAQFAVSFLGQSVLILSLAVLAAKLFRTPDVRLGMLRYVFLGVVLIAGLRLVAPGFSNPWLSGKAKPAVITPASIGQPIDVSDVRPDAAEAKSVANFGSTVPFTTPPSSVPSASAATPIDLLTVLLYAWAVGSAILLVRALLGLAWLRGLHRSSTPVSNSRVEETLAHLSAQFGVERVDVAESDRIGSPLVAGIWWPTVYVPAGSEFSDGEIEAILAHELAHVRGSDTLWALLTQIIVAMLWPNPFAWIARRQMNTAAEERCDLSVLHNGTEPETYAECLLRIAERSSGASPASASAVGMFTSRNQLARRISLLFETARMTPKALHGRGRAQLACSASALALASCLMVPAPTAKPSATQGSKESGNAGAFPPSKEELELAKTSNLPYISGDFTLAYHVVIEDVRSDAVRQAEFDKNHAEMKKRLDAAVSQGDKEREDADAELGRDQLAPRPKPEEHEITLSSRRGLLLYKDSAGFAVLLTHDHVYSTRPDQGDMSDLFDASNTMLMPLPAAGFAHVPLSLETMTSKGATVNIPDVPLFGAMGNIHQWDGKLSTDLARGDIIAEFNGTGQNRRLVKFVNHGSTDYVFTRFMPFKGTRIASEYTRFYCGRRCEYKLKSAESKALPESEFAPGQVLRGQRLQLDYLGRHLNFEADPDGSDFQTQVEAQARVADAKDIPIRLARAYDTDPGPLPGLMPDIMPLYNQALAKARAEGKIVLAITTASTCPPCHQLAKMFGAPEIKTILDRHFEVLWIDCGERAANKKYENKNGQKLAEELDLMTGFPSFATVARDGTVLERTGTLGYPGSTAEDARFFKVLNAGRKLLSSGERHTMQAYLDSHQMP